MAYSSIEKEFEEQCHSIHPDIDASIFFKDYNYYQQRIPLLGEKFTALHQYVHDKLPNIDFSFTARLKAKKSFLDKKMLKLAENIETIFPNGEFDDKKREEAIKTYLKFLPEERFNQIKKYILATTPVETLKAFSFVFEQLSKEEKELFIKSLARTEDTFGYSISVKNVNYPISDIKMLEDGSFRIIENCNVEEKMHLIYSSIKFNPETDIIEKSSRNIKYICVDGHEYPLNEKYLLYPPSLPASKRNLQYALRDSNGMVTLLQDSIVLGNGDDLPIESISYDENMNTYFLVTPQGDRINLTSRMSNENLILKKYDEKTCQSAIYTISSEIKAFDKQNQVRPLNDKDYIENPKKDDANEPYYWAFHIISEDQLYRYKIEGQLRSFFSDVLYSGDHDDHKQERIEEQSKNPIIAMIREKDPIALDASTSTLMKLLEDNPDIDIMDVMGTYFFTSTFANGKSKTYLLEPETTFTHIFGNYANKSTDKSHLDFSSYANFIASRAAMQQYDLDDGLER